MGNFTVDITTQNFETEVIERSRSVPVLVDFWAPWCGPCRALTPILEKLAAEYQGKFMLAKLNTDEHSALASEFGIRSIPNVKAFRDGEVVDEFLGALPESAVRKFIERWVPSESELLRRDGRALLDRGNPLAALEKLNAALALDPASDAILLDQAQALTQLERLEEARSALNRMSALGQTDARAQQLTARLDFAARGAAVGDVQELKRKVENDAKDMRSRLELADWHVSRGEYEPALALLLQVVQRDRKFGEDAGRKKMLELFSLLGNGGDLVDRYRRLLASALH